MARYESRLATSYDVPILYDLLSECIIQENLEEEFTNSKTSFEEHFKEGLFKALVTEVLDDTEQTREIIGYVFLSYSYLYMVGRSSSLHCSYIKPTFRNRGLEQTLIKFAKKVSLDEDIHLMKMIVNGRDATYRSALEAEGGIDMSTMPKGAGDLWFMPNPSSTPQFSNADYVLREALAKDLGGVHSLLQKLIEFEDIGEFRTITKEDFEDDGVVHKDLYGSVIVEHRCRVDNEETGSTFKHEIVGCVLYSKAYYGLMGRTYMIQGLYILPHHTGKGLGKALVKATLKACKDRNGDGFIFMILHDNIVSQALFQSLHGTNMTKSKHVTPYLLRF